MSIAAKTRKRTLRVKNPKKPRGKSQRTPEEILALIAEVRSTPEFKIKICGIMNDPELKSRIKETRARKQSEKDALNPPSAETLEKRRKSQEYKEKKRAQKLLNP
jgi:hypothetical protein